VQHVTCPKCNNGVNIDHGRRAGRGQLRLACPSCGNRFVVQIQKRDLRLEGEVARKPVSGAGEAPGDRRFALVIEHLEINTDPTDLFMILRHLPTFAADPTQISRIPQLLPFPITGLREAQARQIEAELKELAVLCKVGPERQILVGPLRAHRDR